MNGMSTGRTATRGVSLLELLVALSIVGLLGGLTWHATAKARRARSAEQRVDDIQTIHSGLERLRRGIETARTVLYPRGQRGRPEPRLVYRDEANRVVTLALEGEELVQWSCAAGVAAPSREVVMRGVDAIWFDFRGDSERVVRLQLALAGLSFITSVRYFNDSPPRAIEPLEDLFVP